ncbi:hypothetical protein [Natrinema soli]|uniref:Uncharacterized protein n=1 Tax=Natrinema soli TaxID=1930624 RepID=A0ABD5SXL3_9EURY|nr:hypothetical protein [Natrinema soli]
MAEVSVLGPLILVLERRRDERARLICEERVPQEVLEERSGSDVEQLS